MPSPRAQHSPSADLLHVVSDLDVDVVFERTLSAAMHATGAGAGVLVVDGSGFRPRLLADSVDEEQATVLRAEVTAQPLVGQEPQRQHSPAVGPTLRGRLRLADEQLGELVLLDPPAGGFDDDVVEEAALLLDVAGVALRNARTYRLSEMRRQWSELATRVTESIHPPFALLDPVQRIVEGVHSLAAASMTAVVRSIDGQGYDVPAVIDGESSQGDHGPLLSRVLHQVDPQVQSAQRSGEHFEARWGEDGTIAGFPLSPELAFEGVVLMVYPLGAGVLPVHERELLSSFVTHGSLVMDRAVLQTEREREHVAADRLRIARDLHDVVIQRLFATGMRLKTAVREEALTGAVVEAVTTDLDTTIRDIRGTIFELEHGRDTSLRAEVESLVREYEPALGFRATLRTFGAVNTLTGQPISQQVTAVLREGLANCARHADASACVIEVAVEDKRVSLVVVDDGHGLPEGAVGGSGLRNLRRRAEQLGGELRVETVAPRGTRLTWWVPLSMR